MSSNSVIICKPTQWIKIRAVLIILMFSIFSYMFYKDGTVGYREKNEQYFFYQLFNDQAPSLAKELKTEDAWKTTVSELVLKLPSEDECPLPLDFDRTQKWPQELAGSYHMLKNTNKATNAAWDAYTARRGWGSDDVADHPEDSGSLRTQMGMAYGFGGLAVIVLLLFIRTLNRTMEVTEEAYLAPGGVVVPFSAMRRIDRRNWDTKGVATIEYENEGVRKKVKVDGMIYGHFKEADGAPAEKLFAHVLERFKGEVVDYEKDTEGDASSTDSDTSLENKNSEPVANS